MLHYETVEAGDPREGRRVSKMAGVLRHKRTYANLQIKGRFLPTYPSELLIQYYFWLGKLINCSFITYFSRNM